MFDEIKKDTNRKPLLTYVIAILCVIITGLAQVSEQIYFLFGNFEGSVNIIKIFALPFFQGFDIISSSILLIPLLFFWIEIGGFVEKVIGPERFSLLITYAFISYGSMIFVTGQPGHGLSPIIFACIPVLYIVMRESASIKMANTYSNYYRYFQVLSALLVITSIVIFTFLPIYFNYNAFKTSENHNKNEFILRATFFASTTVFIETNSSPKKGKDAQFFGDFKSTGLSASTLLRGFLLGNLMHLVGFLVGLYFALRYRKRIGGTLTRFNRRKYLSEKSYKPIYIFTAAISGYLIVVFILSLFIEI
jgi:hypothetical protein